ncbi:uncharacterized protein LOC122069740 [Macadamia integrifolia]|uniref:uncharacterized protein LOC122069740 n=1 Tax=Macadamia integrifolia TaxID=60698 RepID=UPI001C4F0067|nr:uncharacterized protein LOC122069740 [Macadamia integrifolia]
MSAMSSLLLFLLCLTVYPCNARRLGIIEKKSSRQVHLHGQDLEKAIVETLVPVKVKLAMFEEVQERRQGLSGAKIQKLKDTKALPKGVEERRGKISGTQILMPSDVGLRQATKKEGSERRVLSLVGSTVHLSQERVNSKENYIKEDAVFMDYANPRRKPPIHNISP